jgi:hypothetical protein
MALDLEIAGVVRELSEGEAALPVPARPRELVRLRDSHHQVARLFAAGLRPGAISAQTGYALSRLSILQNDPAFIELVEFYKTDARDVSREVEGIFLNVTLDSVQELHDRVLDRPEEIADETLINAIKVLADRAGYAPVQRSVNKNLNAKVRKDEAA